MANTLMLGKDVNSNVTYELPVSNSIYRTTLAPNVAQTLTIPSNTTRAFFSYSNGTDVWVDFKSTATLPTGAFQPATSELTPVARWKLNQGENISFISPTTAYVEVAFYN